MAKHLFLPGRKEIYDTLEVWKERALTGDDSLFTPGRPIWSLDNLNELQQVFVDNPDTSSMSFFEKLEKQFANASDEATQLMAEMLYVHYLASDKMTQKTKLEGVESILAWMDKPITIPEPLAQLQEYGLINPGQFFLAARPLQLCLFIEFMQLWKNLDAKTQTDALGDPVALKQLVNRCTTEKAAPQRHLLLHYVQPEAFEAIASNRHKEQIAAAFEDLLDDQPDDLDERLLAIRQHFVEEGEALDFSFYREPFDKRWKETKQKKPRTTTTAEPANDVALRERIPEAALLPIAKTLADLIETANATREDSWSLHPRGKHMISFIVGMIRIINFGRYYLRLNCDRSTAEPSGELVEFHGQWKSKSDPELQNYKIRWSRVPELWNERLAKACLVAAERASDRRTAQFARHSDALMQELREITGRALPRHTPPDAEPDREQELAVLEAELNFPEGTLEEIVELVEEKGQLIFSGPPGTGKTFVARKIALHLAGSKDRVRRVQFHPSYSYEDFVEGIRPDQEGRLRPKDGPIKLLSNAAQNDPERTYVLFIDEINRGNLAKILGELYYLLEYRDDEIQLQYSDEPFSIPENVVILGTMNTADRSIALVDLALRRRFYFYELMPDRDPVKAVLRSWLETNASELVWVADVVERLNEKIGDPNVAVGPSYFMPRSGELTRERLERVWEHAVIPYVSEHFFGHEDQLRGCRLDVLQKEVQVAKDAAQA